MMIDKISIANQPLVTNGLHSKKISTPNEAHQAFSTMLKNAINNVNDAQNKSDEMTVKLAKGENVDLHQVMISAEKASVTMAATMEIRNKVIEAYQEVMRMQV
jgi:flagellar hook-basal body complex protein FliE